MSDEAWLDRLKLLSPEAIHNLAEALLEYFDVMPGGAHSSIRTANMVEIHILSILRGDTGETRA